MRGRTTQKRVSSTRWAPKSFSICALATTSFRSGENHSDLTTPTCTSRYLSLVLPASMPSAFLKRMVMVGPRSTTVLTASHPASSAATSGTSHTAGIGQRARPGGTAWGVSAGFSWRISARISVDVIALRGPDEPRVEAHRGEHGEPHDRGEGEGARAGLDVRERPGLHQRRQDRDHEDVEHRPAADELHHAIGARAAARLPGRA